MRVFDTFSFFNELDLLKLRCETLKELNPIHVLVEATSTHTGDPKPLYFADNKEKFKEYNIIHLVVNLPNTGDSWVNEKYQRDACVTGLHMEDIEDEDVVIVSDLDEIPNPDVIKRFTPEMEVGALKMNKYCMYLNCLEGWQQWEVGRVTNWSYLKNTTPSILRNGGFKTVMLDAGWHFSFLGGVEKMREKLFAYAHTESVTGELLSSLEKKYESGQSLWGKDYWRFVEIDGTFPMYLQTHQMEFSHLIKSNDDIY